jgi:hypothetical protein
VYDAEYRGHLERVRECIDPIPNLHTVGRNGMHKYNNQDHSMLTAMLAVANMQGAAHDVWAVNTDFEYLEEQRIDAPTATSEVAGEDAVEERPDAPPSPALPAARAGGRESRDLVAPVAAAASQHAAA